MKRLILNSFLFTMLSIFAVSCTKEKVAPFNGGNANASEFTQRDGGGDPTVTGTVTDDGSGITDGGNSSDYDSKGSKKRKN